MDLLVDVLVFVCVDEAELLEVKPLPIIVNSAKYILKVTNRELNTAKLAALNELLELHAAVEVDIKGTERLAVILKLLFDTMVYQPQIVLDLLLLLTGKLLVVEAPVDFHFFVVVYALEVTLSVVIEISGQGILEVLGAVIRLGCEHGAPIENVLEGFKLVEAQSITFIYSRSLAHLP